MIRGLRAVTLLTSVLTATALCACTQQGVVRSTSAVPRATETQSSEAALADAAKKTYVAYIRVSSEVSHDRGDGVERLKPFLSKDAYARERKSVGDVAAQGLHTEGAPKLTVFRVQTVDARESTLSAYVCVDFSDVQVKDRSGKDVTPRSRPGKQTSLSSFVREGNDMVLMKDEAWAGSSVC